MRGGVRRRRRALSGARQAHGAEHLAREGRRAAALFLRLREMPVEDDLRQAVHQRPSRRRREGGVGAELGEAPLELLVRQLRARAQGGMGFQVQRAAEHQPEALRMRQREFDVSLAELARRDERQRLAVGEMAVRGVVRHAGATRGLPQRKRRAAALLDQLARGAQECRRKIAVMICCH